MISVERETFCEIIDDIFPLLSAHWQEVEWGQDVIPLNPDLSVYKTADEAGTVALFGMRDNGELVGYNTFWIYKHPHHADTVFAVNDMLYIKPKYRNGEDAPNLVWFCEQILKAEGCDVITYHMKYNKSFKTLMDAQGYEHTECVYSKFIGN